MSTTTTVGTEHKKDDMNKNKIIAMALAIGAAPLSQASSFNLATHTKDAFKLFDAKRDHAENPWLQEFSMKLRGQYQWGYLDPAGGSDRVKGNRNDNNEWRRFRLGAQAKVLENFTLKGIWNIGGLDARNKFSNGMWNRSRTEGTLDELTISTKTKSASFTLGKHKPAYMAEYRTSSAKIMTMERSVLVNQLKAEKLYGLSVSHADSKAEWGWNAGLWLNGQRDTSWLEPSFNSDDSATLGLSVSRATGKDSSLRLDYMHSFHKDGKVNEGSAYAGPGAEDVFALSWETKQGKLNFMAEALAGLNVYDGQSGAQNVFGLVAMPSYRFSPHWEGVVRYQLASGSNAVKGDSRYYTTNSTYSSTSDLLQGLYLGANYYVCPENPNMLKLMLGAEYFNSEGKDAKGNKGFTGWQFSSAVRFDF